MMTWSNNWISRDESIWSILMKFKVANAINNEYFKKNYILPASSSSALFEEFFPYTLNYSLLSNHLNLDFPQQITQQIERWGLNNLNEKCLTGLISKCFRYCPKCLMLGFHSTLHQLQMFEFCPYHRDKKLLSGCQKCKQTLYLESLFNERDYYKCRCGQHLVDEEKFYKLIIKWKHTANLHFNKCLFFKNQIVLYPNAVISRQSEKNYYDILNCIAEYELSNEDNLHEKTIEDVQAFYKAFLRRIRNQCKKKCLKSYYKLGNLTLLCNQCKSYLKLRGQFEDISSEWDFLSKLKLKKEKNDLLRGYLEQTMYLLDISSALTYNLFHYMLFFEIMISYQRLLKYVNTRYYDENHVISYIITKLESHKIKISVHY